MILGRVFGAGVVAAIAGLGAATAQIGPGAFTYEQASVLAGPCLICHGPDGGGAPPIPSLAGMPPASMIAKVAAFRAGEIPGATIMARIVFAYSDAEIAAIADYFAGMTGP